jgi:hypothetical protein
MGVVVTEAERRDDQACIHPLPCRYESAARQRCIVIIFELHHRVAKAASCGYHIADRRFTCMMS